MNIIFLDNDGVICLSNNWGTRLTKQKKWGRNKLSQSSLTIPLKYRFDNFDRKSIKVLNDLLILTDSDIVVSSDWRLYATLDELGEYYEQQGIIKRPIGITKTIENIVVPDDFPWQYNWYKEQCRCLEIKEYLINNPNIKKWVSVDDLHLGKTGLIYGKEFYHDWGLDYFVQTPLRNEGIKQTGIKEKIIKTLMVS